MSGGENEVGIGRDVQEADSTPACRLKMVTRVFEGEERGPVSVMSLKSGVRWSADDTAGEASDDSNMTTMLGPRDRFYDDPTATELRSE